MTKFYESIDSEIFRATTRKLIERLTSEDLITYMEQFQGRSGVTHEMYNGICDMLLSGEIRLVDTAWKNEPGNGFTPKKPTFINLENYKIVGELKKDKRDWERNWREYQDKYPVRGRYDNKAEFWMGEACSRNMDMVINKSYLSRLTLNPFQFMLVVYKNKESYSYDDYGQEYIFEFTGEDSKTKFVEYFRDKICRDMAEKLMGKRREKFVEDESNRIIMLYPTLSETNNEK